jgi:uncharacterized protein
VIYLDTCIVIYAVESQTELGDRARAQMEKAGPTPFAISPLVVHETLVGPIRRGNRQLIDVYEEAFASYTMVTLEMPAFVRAAELRAAAHGLKTVDALHLAAAQLSGCTALWTNDRRLTAASHGLAVDIFSE